MKLCCGCKKMWLGRGSKTPKEGGYLYLGRGEAVGGVDGVDRAKQPCTGATGQCGECSSVCVGKVVLEQVGSSSHSQWALSVVVPTHPKRLSPENPLANDVREAR